MADIMTFPDTYEEFEKCYGIVDSEEVYTNGALLIPAFRVRQWFNHKPERKKGEWIDELCSICGQYVYSGDTNNFCPNCGADMRGEKDGSNN